MRWVRVLSASAIGVVVVAAGLVLPPRSAGAAAPAMPDTTITRYEHDADAWVTFQQGAADGRAHLSGAAILDFGRPASDASGNPATLDFGGHLDPLSEVVSALERYIDGYRLYAPAGSKLVVLAGTNDSCGAGQPCGSGTCGCANEPPSYLAWGQAWGAAVTAVDDYATTTAPGYDVEVRAGGADDAEPGFDPGYTNTYETLAGYAEATARPMLDYGSLDGGPGASFWTAAQMYQVAYGFRPDAPFPEIYYPGMAGEWADLSHWAAVHASGSMTMSGVLTEYPRGYSPAQGYSSLLSALNQDYPDTHQAALDWSSNVGATPALADPAGLGRLAGADRVATAVAVSEAAFPTPGSARAAVLATSLSYPDALVGGPLAAAKDGPLLLTSPRRLDPATAAELARVTPKGSTVYLLGGVSALSEAVASQVAERGYPVVRLAGVDRYGTAVAVARALGDPPRVLLATGSDFPDALLAGVAAAEDHGAVLLSAGALPAPETSAYLLLHPGDRTYAIGVAAASAYPGATAVSGPDRYATAAAVAGRFFASAPGAGLASGSSFPDGLVAATLLVRQGWPLLLSPSGRLAAPVQAYLGSVPIRTLEAFGGTGALSQAAAFQARYVASR